MYISSFLYDGYILSFLLSIMCFSNANTLNSNELYQYSISCQTPTWIKEDDSFKTGELRVIYLYISQRFHQLI